MANMAYRNMTKQGLLNRAMELVTFWDQADNQKDLNVIRYTAIRSEAERYLHAKYRRKPCNKALDNLVKDIYKELVQKPRLNIDNEWVDIIVFDKQPSVFL